MWWISGWWSARARQSADGLRRERERSGLRQEDQASGLGVDLVERHDVGGDQAGDLVDHHPGEVVGVLRLAHQANGGEDPLDILLV